MEGLSTDDEPRKTFSCTDGSCALEENSRPKPSVAMESGERDVSDGKRTKGAKWHPPPKSIFKPFTEAVDDFQMVRDGDRVLVCLSGGKDSLSLLHTMRQYQFQARKNGVSFELGALTIDPLSSAYDPRPLIPYCAELGVSIGLLTYFLRFKKVETLHHHLR